MAYYKIKNITNTLAKRDINKDQVLKIENHYGLLKQYKDLPAGGEILLSCKTLPASIHGLRAKKFISIVEISENEFNKLQKPSAKKKVQPPKREVPTTTLAPTTTKNFTSKRSKSKKSKPDSTLTLGSEE